MREQSIDRLCKWWGKRSGIKYEIGRRRLGKRRQSVTGTISSVHHWWICSLCPSLSHMGFYLWLFGESYTLLFSCQLSFSFSGIRLWCIMKHHLSWPHNNCFCGLMWFRIFPKHQHVWVLQVLSSSSLLTWMAFQSALPWYMPHNQASGNAYPHESCQPTTCLTTFASQNIWCGQSVSATFPKTAWIYLR